MSPIPTKSLLDATQVDLSCSYCLRRFAVDKFKQKLQEKNHDFEKSNQELLKSFENKLTSVTFKESGIKSNINDSSNSVIGTLYYDHTQISTSIAKDFYDLLFLKEKKKKENEDILLNSDFIKVSDIAEMIDEQTRKLSEAEASYDYRELFKEDNLNNMSNNESSYFLGKHLHKPLADLLERVLKIDPKKNVSENHKARLKIQMIIGILCN